MLEPFKSGPSERLHDFEQKLSYYKFWVYACHNRFYHAAEYQMDHFIQEPLLKFLNDKRLMAAYVQVLYTTPLNAEDWHKQYPRNFNKAHVSARSGLDDIFLLYVSSSTIDDRDSRGMTSLLLAAKFRHTAVVQAALHQGAEINAWNVNWEFALALAAKSGHSTYIVQLLISLGARIDMEDNKGWTGLDWAVILGNVSLVEQSLQTSGGHVLSDGKGCQALFLAAEEGHAHIVQLMLDYKVEVNARDAEGSTALDWAVPAGRLASTKVLLENGASVDCKDNYENTVLHWAIQDGDMASQDGTLSAAECLLHHGVDVDARDTDGFRPLHQAVLEGRMDMVVLLLDQGAEPGTEDDKFWTPFRVALVKGHKDIACLLSTRISNAPLVSTSMAAHLADCSTNAYFNTCLEEKAQASTVLTGLRAAIQANQFERVRNMLENRADVNAHDTGGWTALMMALWSGSLPIMQLLLEKGAKIDYAGWDGQTVLHWAAQDGDKEEVQFLIDHSANVDVNAFGQSPAMLAAKKGKTSITIQLVANGANSTQADYHHRTLMHWAARHADMTLLRILLDRGVDVNATDRWGRTVLMWALETDGNLLLDYQRLAVLKLLLENGADIAARAQHCITALHLAAYVGSIPILQCLLDANAHPETQTHWCDDPIWWDSDMDTADINNTNYNAVRLMTSKKSNGLTASEIAHEVGMFAAVHLLENRAKPSQPHIA